MANKKGNNTAGMVWEIADLHGGSVRVAESSKQGTTIAVELPALSYS